MKIIVNRVVSKVIKIPVGPKGADGVGLPTGGTTGQMAVKASGADYDVIWTDQASGGLLAANNLSDVANVNTARQNLLAITDEESIINSLIFG